MSRRSPVLALVAVVVDAISGAACTVDTEPLQPSDYLPLTGGHVTGDVAVSGRVEIASEQADGRAGLLVGSTLVDEAATAAAAQVQPRFEVTSTAARFSKGLNVVPQLSLPSGVTNGGYVEGVGVTMLRDGADDAGSLNDLAGVLVQHGHYDNVERHTQRSIGVLVMPYRGGGTIDQSCDLYLARAERNNIGSAPGSYFGMYQADPTAANYFAGRVGVGADILAPAAALDVQGSDPDPALRVSLSNSSNHIRLERTGSIVAATGSWNINVSSYFVITDNKDVAHPRLYIDASGRLGVGTTDPRATLDVAGTARLKRYAAQPFACDAAADAALAMTAAYTLCTCRPASGWVKTTDGSTACVWQ